MALFFDAVGPNASGQSVANVQTTSWSHTMASGANGLLLGALGYLHASDSTPPNVTALSYNSVDMLPNGPIARQTIANGFSQGMASEFYRLIAPSTGTNTVSITWDVTGVYATCGTVSYTGADQTTGTGNTNVASGTAGTAGAPTVASVTGNRVLDVCHLSNPGSSLNATQTQLFNGSYFTLYAVGSQDAAGAASVTMDWTFANPATFTWSGVEILAFVAGGSVLGQYFYRNIAGIGVMTGAS